MSDTRRETVGQVAAWRIDIANAIEGAGSAAAFDIPALLREDSHYLRALLARAEAAERERDEAQTEFALANIEMDTMRTMVRQYIRAGRYEDALGILDATEARP